MELPSLKGLGTSLTIHLLFDQMSLVNCPSLWQLDDRETMAADSRNLTRDAVGIGGNKTGPSVADPRVEFSSRFPSGNDVTAIDDDFARIDQRWE
ncbi:hypothetical protein KZX46_10560 [Polymorphobacter sp. PAMC 29334]|uniref:hypothetical protein n=1 Tax=Polymorphobacter sp. PAMC 29334 TaxID=2862331 RepID=UPI001C76E65D|nr:hypothetical protein [Polymorphobacter sp. PAMC 29334]QYE36324.1 hypothetical protein KZX46_10560 [Polymorphobacter sp. PAMC 29334]